MSRYILSVLATMIVASCTSPRPRAVSGDHVSGKYAGPFMGSPLELEIGNIRGDSVWGRSLHKDQERALAGTRTPAASGFAIVLYEPGDSPYDGSFRMVLDTISGTLEGTWKPKNNPDLSETAFALKRVR